MFFYPILIDCSLVEIDNDPEPYILYISDLYRNMPCPMQ